jgi:hypothetical protein
MKSLWKDENITEALKEMAKAAPEEVVFDRVWFKIEDRLAAPKKRFWNHIIWRPWGHPVRWVAAAACFCLTLTGTFYHLDTNDKNDMVSYMMSVSNAGANVTRDSGLVNVSVLLSEPSTSTAGLLTNDDDHSDVLAGDEILL